VKYKSRDKTAEPDTIANNAQTRLEVRYFKSGIRVYRKCTNTVIPRLTSDPANEFFKYIDMFISIYLKSSNILYLNVLNSYVHIDIFMFKLQRQKIEFHISYL